MGVIYSTPAEIRGGVLLYDEDAMHAFLAKKRDSDCELYLDRVHGTRGPQANKYYWSTVVSRVKEALNRQGVTSLASRIVTHEFLKAHFMDPDLLRRGEIDGYITDSGLILGTTTRQLNGVQFFDYIERIADYAVMGPWQVVIPQPDPDWRLHAMQQLERMRVRTGEIDFNELED